MKKGGKIVHDDVNKEVSVTSAYFDSETDKTTENRHYLNVEMIRRVVLMLRDLDAHYPDMDDSQKKKLEKMLGKIYKTIEGW